MARMKCRLKGAATAVSISLGTKHRRFPHLENAVPSHGASLPAFTAHLTPHFMRVWAPSSDALEPVHGMSTRVAAGALFSRNIRLESLSAALVLTTSQAPLRSGSSPLRFLSASEFCLNITRLIKCRNLLPCFERTMTRR
jgi:hypothetical protein